MKLVIFVIACILAGDVTIAQDITINSPVVTNWGDWGPVELCPTGTYIYGLRIKTEPDQGILKDDTSLNAIELFCISPTVRRNSSEFMSKDPSTRAFATVKSAEGKDGNWGQLYECPDPDFVNGFELMSEPDQGWSSDDTAANNIKLFCTGGTVLTADGLAFGFWTGAQHCPRGLKVCGIQTQVEGENADETGLNNVNLGCCQ